MTTTRQFDLQTPGDLRGTPVAFSRPMLRHLSALWMAAVCLTAGCAASYPSAPTGPAPTARVEIYYTNPMTAPTVSAAIGLGLYNIDTDGVYSYASRASFVSSNPNVLTVLGTSTLIAKAAGTAQITGVFNGFTDSISISVVNPPTYPYLYVYPPFLSIAVGDTSDSRVTYYPNVLNQQDVTQLATWTSSNPRVMTVQQGRVTAVGVGSADITVTYNGLSTWYRLSIPPRYR
jgi:hypothetical protein